MFGSLLLAMAAAIGVLATWWRAGPLAAIGLLAALLALLAVRHGLSLWRLLHWLERPAERPMPTDRGAWATVFERLGRLVREAEASHATMSAELARVRTAVHHMPDALVVLDRWNHVRWCNRSAETVHGIGRGGRPIAHYLRQPEFAAWLDGEATEHALELEMPPHSGRRYQARVFDTEDAHRLLIVHDVTDPVRLEAMRRDFVANVSHELRTPLTVVQGFVETMIDLDLDEASRRHYLDAIQKQTTTMRRLIEDLLALARLEHDAGAIDGERVDIHEMLQALVADMKVVSAGRHDIGLALSGPRWVEASAVDLQTAIRNLVTNAVRYTPEGGRVRVRWSGIGREALLSVEDTGIGIAAEHLPRLTERFYRVDRGRSRDTGGTGLGLAIVKHIAQRHGASLEISSRLGHGSTFSIRWPAERLPAIEDAAAARRTAA